MASSRQRGKKRIWYALFRDSNGKLVEKRTKAKSKREAQEIADELEEMARPSEHHQAAEMVRKAMVDLHRRYLGKDLPRMTVKGYAAYWLDAKQNEVSPATVWFYSHAIELFVAFLDARADLDLYRVTKEDIVRFRDSEAKRVAPKTVNHELKVVRMLFRQARADGWCPENPTESVKCVREQRERRSPKRPFSVDEMKALLAACDADWTAQINRGLLKCWTEADQFTWAEEWRGMIIRGYYTGQRLKDIALMRAADEDLMRKVATFVTSKTGRHVIVQMHPVYEEFVLTRPSGDDPEAFLHPGIAALVQRKDQRTVLLSNQFVRLMAKARLIAKRSHKAQADGPGRNGRRRMGELGYHSLRHSFVSHLKDAGVAPQFVEDMVGHDDAAMNLIYTRLDPATARREVAKLPSIISNDQALAQPGRKETL